MTVAAYTLMWTVWIGGTLLSLGVIYALLRRLYDEGAHGD